MSQGEGLLRGSGMAQQVDLGGGKRYEYQGKRGWDPAQLGPMLTPEQERAANEAEYARLRASGLGVFEAGRRMGVTEHAARWFEHKRREGAQ